MKKRWIAFLLALNIGLTGIMAGSGEYLAAESEVVEIPDENLRDVIINNCDNNGDGVITKAEMETMTTLDASYESIDDLTGLEYAVNLEGLDLRRNDISDISALSGLKNLRYLYLSDNQLTDISALSGLSNLESLYLSTNQLTDISALSGLKNLKYLDLEKNQLTNISALSGLSNLESLYLSTNQITDISGLSGLENLSVLDLGDNQITDISALSGLKNLTDLNIRENQISDISVLSNLKNLIDLDLGYNQITNIDVLSELENLSYLYLVDNQITEIPLFKSCYNLSDIYLRENPIKNIANAKPLLDIEVPGTIYISVDSEYVTQQLQFENFFDTSERKLYVGNGLQLAVTERYLYSVEEVEITYDTANTDLLSIDETGWMVAKKAGTATVTATCDNAQKTFTVTILEPEQAATEKLENVPEVSLNSYGTASVLDEKGTLWSVNNNNGSHEAEYVKENVKNYIANTIYSEDRYSWWNNYIVLDENNQLSSYEKADKEAEYAGTVLKEDVTEIGTTYDGNIYYLTENAELHLKETDTERLLAENVKMFSSSYYNEKILTNSGDVIIMPSLWTDKENYTVCEGVGLNVVFSEESNGFFCLNNGVATTYDRVGEIGIQLENVVEIGVFDREYLPFYAVQSDGTVVELTVFAVGNTYQKDTVAFPVKEVIYVGYKESHVIDAKDTLWYVAEGVYEKIAENVTYANSSKYLKDNTLYAIEDNSILLTDVQEYCPSTSTMYLATDGTVYEWINSETQNKILEDVADIIHVRWESVTYMVREDGSVWRYDGCRENIGVAVEISLESAIVSGDLDGDGEIKVSDMLTILHGISGSQTLTEEQSLAADVDGDGEVTVRDMLRIMHYISGSSSTL